MKTRFGSLQAKREWHEKYGFDLTRPESVQQKPILEEDEEPIQMRSISPQELNNGEITSEFESSLQQARNGGEALPQSYLWWLSLEVMSNE